MKKLMIALAAAAAITGVAKADIDNHVTDFESLTNGIPFNAATDDQDTLGDTYWAIEEGATIVRVGTAIFGERNYNI